MKSGLLSCPPELLREIFTYLGIFDLDSIAKTFNKTIFSQAFPLLQPHIQWINNAKRMTKLFKPKHASKYELGFPGHLPALCLSSSIWGEQFPYRDSYYPDEDYYYTLEAFDLSTDKGPHFFTSPPDLRSWLRLDGSFDWLEPLSEGLRNDWEPHSGPTGERAVVSREEMNDFVAKIRELGLTLPAGFEKFYTSKDLHYRIASMGAWYFYLGEISKAPPALDGGAGGYIFTIHVGQQGNCFAYLYLDTAGGQCVIESLDYLPDYEANTGGGDIQFELVSLTFEEYLATAYYEALLAFEESLRLGDAPSQNLKDYVGHVYKPRDVIESSR